MSETQRWYNEAILIAPVHKTADGEFVIYKGFKLSKTNDSEFDIVDVRYSNMYSSPKKYMLDMFNTIGFVKGCDDISVTRDKKRLVFYTNRIDSLNKKIETAKSELPKHEAKNKKRIVNAKLKIEDYADMILFYQMRINQYNNKYN